MMGLFRRRRSGRELQESLGVVQVEKDRVEIDAYAAQEQLKSYQRWRTRCTSCRMEITSAGPGGHLRDCDAADNSRLEGFLIPPWPSPYIPGPGRQHIERLELVAAAAREVLASRGVSVPMRDRIEAMDRLRTAVRALEVST